MRLFLYGTLQPAANTRMSRWLAPKLRDAVAARVSGRLLAIPANEGWYPALLPDRDGRWCAGTVVTSMLDAADWAVLDRYEGDEYRRAMMQVVTSHEDVVSAPTYLWHGRTPPDAQEIGGGDFLAWLRRHGRLAFDHGA